MKKPKCLVCDQKRLIPYIYEDEHANANLSIIDMSLHMMGNFKGTAGEWLFCKINYCPICGKKLKEVYDDEQDNN